MKSRNDTVDMIRGFAMLLVVLGHTISGTVSEYSDSFLFQLVWTLQMPLFFIISGYVTRYSHPICDINDLWKFVKRRSLSYLFPWTIWTFLIRGLIFGQSNFFNIGYLIWHMDTGYWFLVTIWMISMVFGVTDFICNKLCKSNDNISVLFHLLLSGFWMMGFLIVGRLIGMNFLSIKLTLYYLPIYLMGYLYGHIQEKLLLTDKKSNLIDFAIVISLGLWLAFINRFDFYAMADDVVSILFRFITSILGCIFVIGLFTSTDSNNYQSSKSKPVAEFSPVRKRIVDSSFIWIGVHSLEIYLIHGFSICLLKLADKPVFHSISGLVLIFLNLIITISLSFFYIKLIEKNQLLNKLLFWK